MKFLIAGGSGFLGRALMTKLLQLNHQVLVLSRNPDATRAKLPSSVQIEPWDAAGAGNWIRFVETSDVIVNLTGESIGAKRWTTQQKNLIFSSRINSTRALVEAISKASTKPRALVNQSAVGYYGNIEFGEVTEDHPAGTDFLADVAEAWEKEALKAEQFGVRVVLPRTGVVLDRNNGALPKMLLPFKLFLGGPLGSGRQWFPWIHIEDEVRALIFLGESEGIRGPVNLTAPESVTMEQFCAALAKTIHRPSWMPVPGFVLKLILGEMAGPLLLNGQKATPRKLLESGFEFLFPHIDVALRDLFSPSN